MRYFLGATASGGNHASSYNGGNPRNGLAPQDRAASLSWKQIDLHYWLPQPLKALANAYSTQKVREIPDQKQWKNLQQKLLERYGIPEPISAGFNEADLLHASAKGEPIWHKRSLLSSKDSHFWFEINNSSARVKKMVVTNSPVEAVSAYLVERLVNLVNTPCLYLSLECPEQLQELDLTTFDTVVVNNSDKKLVSDSFPHLVIEIPLKSWQPSWLTYWNESETSLKSETKNKNTLIEKKLNNTMELEL